ncbi:MAG: hypothetical protein WDW36_010242 [Sanguina aurantia]
MMSHSTVALVLVSALLSVLGTAHSAMPTTAGDANSCPNLSITGPPKCFVDPANCGYYPVATRQFDVKGVPNAASVSIAISGATWVITYAFTGFTPVAGDTHLQMTFLEGNTITATQSGMSYRNWTANYAPTCSDTDNQLDFFFLWGQPFAKVAVSTQPPGTSVVYTATTATIRMPIGSKLLPWTYNLGSDRKVNTTALCPGIHGKPMGIFLLTGIFEQVGRATWAARDGKLVLERRKHGPQQPGRHRVHTAWSAHRASTPRALWSEGLSRDVTAHQTTIWF